MYVRIILFLTYFVLLKVKATSFDAHLAYIDDSNIQQCLEQAEYSLLYFSSETCQYCQAFNPTFEYISILYNNLTSPSTKPFQVLKTDGKRNERLSQLFRVNQFPSLYMLNYNTKEIINYQYRQRDLDSIVEFIAEHVPHVSPNFANYKSPLTFADDTLLDKLNRREEDYLVVFVAQYLGEWSAYKYPNHYYQRLASEYNDVRFVLVDVNEEAAGDVIAHYQISNFPSMIYLSKQGIKTLRTDSQNHLFNDKLGESDIREFLVNRDSHENPDLWGVWHQDIHSLYRYLEENIERGGHQQVLGQGFNFVQSEERVGEHNDDEEYELLLEHIEL